MAPVGKTYPVGRQECTALLKRLSAKLAREREIAFAYLFGSVLERNRVHDVDVGVYLCPAAAVPAEYALDLGQRLSSALGIQVDVRVLNSAPVSFFFHVLRGALIVSHDDGLLAQMIERTASRYLDAAPVLRHATREAFAA
jgi:predicted nucleotidyltransferase